MFTLGVFPNVDKDNANIIVQRIVRFCEQYEDVKPVMPLPAASFFNCKQYGVEDIAKKSLNVGVSIGGDGTLLGVCRQLYEQNIPVCGINIGSFGFLADIEPSEIENKLGKIIKGQYCVEERMIVSGYVKFAGNNERLLGNAVNDVVVTADGVARMLHLRLSINSHHVMDYKADGLIVSTATGSTAYSLSAGGPIINPKLKVLLLTPICAHTFNARPMVIDEKDEVSVHILAKQQDVIVTFDGQESVQLRPDDDLIIKTAALPIKIVKFEDKDYYEIIRTKLLGS